MTNDPDHAASGFLTELHMHLLTGGTGIGARRFKLDVPHHPVALEDQIVSVAVHFRAEYFNHLTSPVVDFLENLGNEDVFDELLDKTGLSGNIL